MPAKPLTDEQLADARRLTAAFKQAKERNPSLTQERLAFACGWKTQGTVSQYMLGKIPLNLEALLKFSKVLQVSPESISPTIASQLSAAHPLAAGAVHSTVIETKPLDAQPLPPREQVLFDLFASLPKKEQDELIIRALEAKKRYNKALSEELVSTRKGLAKQQTQPESEWVYERFNVRKDKQPQTGAEPISRKYNVKEGKRPPAKKAG